MICIHGVDAGTVCFIFGITDVFVTAYGQEGNDDDSNSQVSAVAIAVFDDIGQTDDRNGHGQGNDEERDNGRTDNGTLADFFQHMDFRETGREAKDGRNARRNQA